MNKGEAAYATHLEALKRAGHVLEYRYEAMTLKLADDCRLTCDFLVINAEAEVELHEVKPASRGKYYAREDSRIKLKVCAEQYPFRVFVCWPTKDYLYWHREEIAA